MNMPTSRLSLAGAEDFGSLTGDLLEQYLTLLSHNGYVHVTDVPQGFDHQKFFLGFGDPFPGPFGQIVDDILPEPGMDSLYYAGNHRALLPHTEGYECAGLPPRYLALWCVNPPATGNGETTLYDTAPLLSRLPAAGGRWLRDNTYDWHASAGLRKLGKGGIARHPVLETVDGLTVLRVSCNNVLIPASDDNLPAFLALVQREYADNCVSISYQRNDFVHWDNWRILHSRTAFNDDARHLKRIQIAHRAGRRDQ